MKPNDLMLSGVIRMPFEMAMATEISRIQFYSRAQQALNELEALQSQDREDALRYRWLRNRASTEGICVVHIDYWSDEYTGQAHCDVYDGEFLDKEIDHARRVEGGGG